MPSPESSETIERLRLPIHRIASRLAPILVAALAVAPATAQAPGDGPAEAGSTAAVEASEPSATRARGPGLRIYLDPTTGEIVADPTPEQVRALDALIEAERRATARSSAPALREFDVPGLGHGVMLGERFTMATRLVYGPEGAPRFQCSHPLDVTQPGPPMEESRPGDADAAVATTWSER